MVKIKKLKNMVGYESNVPRCKTCIHYIPPRRFLINVGITTSYGHKLNREIYFDPKESLGIGTISGVGIGSTLSFSNPGVGASQIFIPTRSIYIPNHNLETGDSLIYSTNSGGAISVSVNLYLMCLAGFPTTIS